MTRYARYGSLASVGLSVCHGGQADERIIADGSGAFQARVASALDGPFVVLLKQ